MGLRGGMKMGSGQDSTMSNFIVFIVHTLRRQGMQPEWKKVGVLSKILTGKLTGKRYLGRPKWRWVHNILMELIVIIVNMRNWIDLPQEKHYWRTFLNTFNLLVT